MREVVWGIGSSMRIAEEDARDWASHCDCDPEITRVVPISAEQVSRVLRGEVSVETLGLARSAG